MMRMMNRWFALCVLSALACCFAAVAVAQTTNTADAQPAAGYRLFDLNCAHCHGDDARGDEGPDLHGLKKNDARIEKIIKNGIKGEMPAFGKKFSDDDVHALIAWLRTQK